LKHRFSKPATLAAMAALALFATGCKENTIIKANVTPSVDNIFTETFPDTITILSKTFFDDTIATSLFQRDANNNSRAIQPLGTVNDPFFGRTNAGIYFQVVPEKAGFNFSTNSPTVDSAFVVLPYYGFNWGDTANIAPQTLRVYRVTNDLAKGEIYYSKTEKGIDEANPVSQPTVVDFSKLRDSVEVRGTKQWPHVRIRLNDDFVQAMKNASANSTSLAGFLAEIKGLFVAPAQFNNTTGNALSYFELTGASDFTRASVQFFFHEGSSTDVKTAFFNFTTADCAQYGRIIRDYKGYPAEGYFNSTLASDSIVLLQNEPGAAIDLRFPYLKNLPQVTVNRAQVVLTRVKIGSDAGTDNFFPPARIYPIGIDASGALYTVLDREPLTETSPVAFIDGTLQEIDLGGVKISRYVLNLPREIQRAITNKTEQLHLRINGTQTFAGAYRLTAGGNHSLYKVSLNITYSKL
jgi:hypothetical protein